ncbi:unnamed protein product [Ceutorhynchus assimilis]|uniref:Zinc finger PHD-type domain-containing protein n=1 Tax=Ceutorhynchus assimilis TaxID=467358 RepID=A0A9N9QJ24_9CUCU|nr:unnamed protein product [Ceutorhynchus assimilis]
MERDEKVPEQLNQSIVGTRIDEPVQEPGNTQGVPVPCVISPIEMPSVIERNKEEAEIEPVIQLPPKPKSAIVMMEELLALEQTKKVDSEMQSEKAIIKKKLLKGKMKISSDINHIWCPSCSEIESDSPWIQCDTCTRWWHQDCTQYRGSGEFLCEICRF